MEKQDFRKKRRMGFQNSGSGRLNKESHSQVKRFIVSGSITLGHECRVIRHLCNGSVLKKR